MDYKGLKNMMQNSNGKRIYDNVPGGAGHVKRLVEKQAIINSLRSAHNKVSQQCYDENMSFIIACENHSGQVFEIKEAVCKGKYSNNRMPAEIEKLLLECEVSEWYVESMKKILKKFAFT